MNAGPSRRSDPRLDLHLRLPCFTPFQGCNFRRLHCLRPTTRPSTTMDSGLCPYALFENSIFECKKVRDSVSGREQIGSSETSYVVSNSSSRNPNILGFRLTIPQDGIG